MEGEIFGCGQSNVKDKLPAVANPFKRGVIKLQIYLATHFYTHTYSRVSLDLSARFSLK
jgi:hypothetical protein